MSKKAVKKNRASKKDDSEQQYKLQPQSKPVMLYGPSSDMDLPLFEPDKPLTPYNYQSYIADFEENAAILFEGYIGCLKMSLPTLAEILKNASDISAMKTQLGDYISTQSKFIEFSKTHWPRPQKSSNPD